MSDPFKVPAENSDDSLDKKKLEEAPKDSSALSVDDLSIDTSGAFRGEKQAEINAEKSLSKLDIDVSFKPPTSYAPAAGPYSFGAGNPPFQLRKADFIPQLNKPLGEFKPLINDFLKQTKVEEPTRKLSDAEQKELTRSRDSLFNATNTEEAVSNALHLARQYQHLRYIEEAKKAIDLSLGIDPDNHFGKELFKELERMHPADLGTAVNQGEAPTQPLTKSNLRKRILSMTGGKVIVLGDLLIDELLEGKPERISREAPVLILEHVDTELIPGGAANTANNISALGGVCHAIGVCGHDEYATRLSDLFDKCHIGHTLVKDPTRPTTVKTRILSKSHSFKQQLLRLDRISHEAVNPHVENQLIDKLKSVAVSYSAIVLSDYRGGVMTDGLIRSCRAIAAENNLMLIVDAQDDFARFQNVSLMTPNQPDVEKAVGFTIDSNQSLTKAGEELMLLTGAQSLLITRGGAGMVLFQQNEKMVELPAFNRSEVFDVTGAGDTVVGTMALSLVTGSNFIEAMALGNLAAGIVVTKPGTAVTSQKEMLEALDLLKIEE